MYRFIAVFCLASFFSSVGFAESVEAALGKIAADLSGSASTKQVKRITVLDFTDLQGNTNELGRYLAEHLSISLVTSGPGFSVIDRGNLKRILEEHKLSAAGLVDPENAKKLGQFAGVDAIILGTVTAFEGSFSVTAKAISTETTQIVSASRANIERSKDLNSLWSRNHSGAESLEIATASGGTGTKDYSSPISVKNFRDARVEILSFRITSQSSATLVLGIYSNIPASRVLFAVNGNAGMNNNVTVDLYDEYGAFNSLNQMTGLRTPSTGKQGNAYDIISKEYSSGSLNILEKVLPAFLPAGTTQPAIVTVELSRRSKEMGKVFRFQMELITADGGASGTSYKFSLNNILIDGLKPQL